MNSIINDFKCNFNSSVKFNFKGGRLTSDAGCILIESFMKSMGILKLLKSFKTNDKTIRKHTDDQILHQILLQNILAYFNDDDADKLAHENMLTTALGKERLASQPSLSRCYNRMDETTIAQLNYILKNLRKKAYSIEMPEYVIFDIDSTLLNTYGKQEGSDFNFHYQAQGYHPLLCYDAFTGDLISAVLREGSKYCSKDAADFLSPVFREYMDEYPEVNCILRGDSGFASPDIYETCEKHGVEYIIRLKENNLLNEKAIPAFREILKKCAEDTYSYKVEYDEFEYQASTWSHPRRVVMKIEKTEGRMDFDCMFIVTSLKYDPETTVKIYCKRGAMENFIKEGKSEFGFSRVSSHSMKVNSNRFLISALAYNIFNLFRRLTLSEKLRKCTANTIRLAIFKVAARVVSKARYTIFELCSNCAYKDEIIFAHNNIQQLSVQLNE